MLCKLVQYTDCAAIYGCCYCATPLRHIGEVGCVLLSQDSRFLSFHGLLYFASLSLTKKHAFAPETGGVNLCNFQLINVTVRPEEEGWLSGCIGTNCHAMLLLEADTSPPAPRYSGMMETYLDAWPPDLV
jgi:hypothetical protein